MRAVYYQCYRPIVYTYIQCTLSKYWAQCVDIEFISQKQAAGNTELKNLKGLIKIILNSNNPDGSNKQWDYVIKWIRTVLMHTDAKTFLDKIYEGYRVSNSRLGVAPLLEGRNRIALVYIFFIFRRKESQSFNCLSIERITSFDIDK